MTLAGLRRRGVPAVALREFVKRVGMARANSVVDPALFDFTVREYLNRVAARRMACSKNDSSRGSSEWLTARRGMRDFGFQRPHPNGVPSLPSTCTRAPGLASCETWPIILGQIEGWKVWYLIWTVGTGGIRSSRGEMSNLNGVFRFAGGAGSVSIAMRAGFGNGARP